MDRYVPFLPPERQPLKFVAGDAAIINLVAQCHLFVCRYWTDFAAPTMSFLLPLAGLSVCS